MKKILMAMVACVALAGCAANAPESNAQQADDAACTAQADALYNSETVDEQARTSQNGLLYAPMPTHVFDAEQLGAEHVPRERDHRLRGEWQYRVRPGGGWHPGGDAAYYRHPT